MDLSRAVWMGVADFRELRDDLGLDKTPHYPGQGHATALKRGEVVFLLIQAIVYAQERGLIDERPESA
jgi:hypothetical protein